jgi:hypothetical protein
MTPPEIIPLAAVDSQLLTCRLGTQDCQIAVYGKSIAVPVGPTGGLVVEPPSYAAIKPVFLDLYVNGALVLGGILAVNDVKMVRSRYLGFTGDLAWIDTQGSDDPLVAGLGTRWLLTWWPDLP